MYRYRDTCIHRFFMMPSYEWEVSSGRKLVSLHKHSLIMDPYSILSIISVYRTYIVDSI